MRHGELCLMRLREREGGKEQTAELRAPAIAPAAVRRRPFTVPAIAVAPIARMTKAEAGRRGRLELNSHVAMVVRSKSRALNAIWLTCPRLN
jgi:hypothetical protein